ncbi:MAG: PEP-utilizing enzyme [Candidatus Magasanikbacteria bacterium]
MNSIKEILDKIPKQGWEAIASRGMDFLKTSLFTPVAIKPIKKIIGVGYSCRMTFGTKDFVSTYVLTADIEKIGRALKGKFFNHPAVFRKFLQTYYRLVAKINKDIVGMAGEDMKKLSNAQLINILHRYFTDYAAIFPYGMIGNRVATAGLAPIVKQFLDKKHYPESWEEVLNKLVVPPRQTYIFQEESNLLSLAVKISQSPSLKGKLIKILNQNSPVSFDKLLTVDVKLAKWLNAHYKKYFWVLLAMNRDRWEEKITGRLREFLSFSPGELKEKFNSHCDSWRNLIKIKQQLTKKLRPNGAVRQAIRLLGEFVALRDHFGPINRYIPEAVRPLLLEAGRRLGLDYDAVTLLTKEEIMAALKEENHGLLKNIIRERGQYYALIDDAGGQQILSGQNARALYEKMFPTQKNEPGWQTVRGQIACKGVARGPARVVLTMDDLKLVQLGDIMISPNTSTEMMAAIKKVAGIATDEGGMGSHAAIVSREFSIPCIVGTKIGTKTIKNYEMIEVDANAGVIKKIS